MKHFDFTDIEVEIILEALSRERTFWAGLDIYSRVDEVKNLEKKIVHTQSPS